MNANIEINEDKNIEIIETRLKSVSFLPLTDHGYEQAPYITITKAQYEKMHDKIKPLKIKENVNELQERFCDGEVCIVN